MFGPDILVTPVLNVNEHVTTAYIPPLHGGDVGWEAFTHFPSASKVHSMYVSQ